MNYDNIDEGAYGFYNSSYDLNTSDDESRDRAGGISGQLDSHLDPASASAASESFPFREPVKGDWNVRYQAALDKPETHSGESLEKYRELAAIYGEFQDASVRYGRTIIEEILLDSEKTVQCASLGGVAGGTKYIVNGIMFKLSTDTQLDKEGHVFMYGGTREDLEKASKAAAHEIKGASCAYSVFNSLQSRSKTTPALSCSKNIETKTDDSLSDEKSDDVAEDMVGDKPLMRVPMQVMLDYKGFRMIAMPLLPISGSTLVYGSGDGGRSVLRSDESISTAMDLLGQELHLQQHCVNGTQLYTAGDVEGHRGQDGRSYILDLARLLPPESPESTSHLLRDGRAVFYRLLRPKFLQYLQARSHEPVNPDCFTGWNTKEVRRAEHRNILTSATNLLVREVIPQFAAWLDKTLRSSSKAEIRVFHLSQEMHKRGINMRHLGLLRSLLQQGTQAEGMVLSEIVTRSLKNLLRAVFRGKVPVVDGVHIGTNDDESKNNVGRPKKVSIKGSIARLLTELCSMTSVSETGTPIWEAVLRKAHNLYGPLSVENLNPLKLAKKNFKMLFPIVTKALHEAGLALEPSSCSEFETTPIDFTFTDFDLIDGDVAVKPLPVLSIVEGRLLLLQKQLSTDLGMLQIFFYISVFSYFVFIIFLSFLLDVSASLYLSLDKRPYMNLFLFSSTSSLFCLFSLILILFFSSSG